MKFAICLVIIAVATAAQASSVADILHYKDFINQIKPIVRDETLLTKNVCELSPGNWLDLNDFFIAYARKNISFFPNGKLDSDTLQKDLGPAKWEIAMKADIDEDDLCVKIPKFYQNYLLISADCKI